MTRKVLIIKCTHNYLWYSTRIGTSYYVSYCHKRHRLKVEEIVHDYNSSGRPLYILISDIILINPILPIKSIPKFQLSN